MSPSPATARTSPVVERPSSRTRASRSRSYLVGDDRLLDHVVEGTAVEIVPLVTYLTGRINHRRQTIVGQRRAQLTADRPSHAAVVKPEVVAANGFAGRLLLHPLVDGRSRDHPPEH